MAEYRTQQPVNAWIWFKSLVFFISYNLMGIVHGTVSVIVGPLLPFRIRFRFINLWTHGTMWLLRRLNGVKIEVRGLDHIPADGRFVVVCNHQSSWETFYLETIFSPQATVLKRELLWVPFFGWALALLRPIVIDRSKPSVALKQILKKGAEHLNQKVPVVIYPEGTRQAPGTFGKFNPGGPMLACREKVPLLPVVHNSGDCWPARSMLRAPGRIILTIGPALSCDDIKPKEAGEKVEKWMHEEFARVSREVGHDVPESAPASVDAEGVGQ